MAELMRETFLDMGLQVQWQQVEDGRANVLGHARGRGRRSEPHVQRAHGHVVLGSRAVAAARARLPAERVRRGREAVRPRDLEHEGRARVLRRGATRAGRRRRAAPRRRHDRGGLRRDREDAVGRRAGRRVPRLRGRLAPPRLARRRRRHVHPRRADRVEGRPRPLRLALAPDLDAGPVHPHRVQRGEARPELDRADARRPRRRARVDPDLGGRPVERVPRREGDRQRRRRRGRLRLARLPHAAPHRSLPRRARAADEGDDGRALARCSRWCAGSRTGSPSTGSRARCT